MHHRGEGIEPGIEPGVDAARGPMDQFTRWISPDLRLVVVAADGFGRIT